MAKIKSIIIHAPRNTLTYTVGEHDNVVDKDVLSIGIFVDSQQRPVYAEIKYKDSKSKTTFYNLPMMIIE